MTAIGALPDRSTPDAMSKSSDQNTTTNYKQSEVFNARVCLSAVPTITIVKEAHEFIAPIRKGQGPKGTGICTTNAACDSKKLGFQNRLFEGPTRHIHATHIVEAENDAKRAETSGRGR